MTKLTIAQAAAILGIPVRTVQGRIRRGQLAAERVGPARRCILLIEAADVEAEKGRVYKVGRPPKESKEKQP
jgi:excisionase family DNA binding protein